MIGRFLAALRRDPATRWRTGFLALTALVIGLEIKAAADGDPGTDPWTDLVVRHVPWEVTAAVIGALVLWLPAHFGIRYWRKRKAAREAGMGGE